MPRKRGLERILKSGSEEDIIELRCYGKSAKDIAKKYHVSENIINSVLRRFVNGK